MYFVINGVGSNLKNCSNKSKKKKGIFVRMVFDS